MDRQTLTRYLNAIDRAGDFMRNSSLVVASRRRIARSAEAVLQSLQLIDPKPEPTSAIDDAQTTSATEARPIGTIDDGQSAFRSEAVQEVLDDFVRPALQDDGGDIELVRIEDNDIYVRLVGACAGCPSSTATLYGGVERLLREEFPEMGDLIQIGAYEMPAT